MYGGTRIGVLFTLLVVAGEVLVRVDIAYFAVGDVCAEEGVGGVGSRQRRLWSAMQNP